MGGAGRRLNVLVSYGTIGERTVDLLRPDWDVFLDSGAFTNFKAGRDVVTLDGYCSFLERHGSKFWRYLNLDRIGDPERSRANFAELRRRGFAPVPVFQRGAPLAELEAMAAESDLVAIGGIAGGAALPGRSATAEFVTSVLKQTRRLGVRAHLLGVGSYATLVEHKPFSADSSDYAKGSRYGELRLWDPRARKFGYYRRTRPKMDRAMAQLLGRYGIALGDLDRDEWWRRGATRASTIACFEFTEFIARMGVKYFMATTMALGPIWDEYAQCSAA